MDNNTKYIKSFDIFLVTSVISSKARTYFTPEQRYNQTLLTIESIRANCTDSFIILVEGSETLQNEWVNKLKLCCDKILTISKEDIPNTLSLNISIGESTLLRYGMSYIQQFIYPYLDKNKIKIYKLSGRYTLTSDFNKEKYPTDKYGFTMYNEKEVKFHNIKNNIVYITALFSVPFIKIMDFLNYIQVINSNIEHDLYDKIPKDQVYLITQLGVMGKLGETGEYWKK